MSKRAKPATTKENPAVIFVALVSQGRLDYVQAAWASLSISIWALL